MDTKNGARAASSRCADRTASDSVGADSGFEVRTSHSAGACSGAVSRCGADAIDEAMKLGCNDPIGPLARGDLIGADVQLAVMQARYEGFEDSAYRPAPLRVERVEAGYLGRRSGRGFYACG